MKVTTMLRMGLIAAVVGLAPAGCATVATGFNDATDQQQVQLLIWQNQLVQQQMLEQSLLASQQAQQAAMMMSITTTPPCLLNPP